MRTTALLGLLASAPAVRALPISYDYLVDTNSAAGVVADLYFALSPGFLGTPPALTATISSFTSPGATLLGAPSLLGAASGTLPGTVVLDNVDATNQYIQSLTLGSLIRFRVTFSGNTGSPADSGSSFAFGLFDGNGVPLFTTDPLGDIARVNIDSAGNAALEGLQPIPEPSSALLTALAAASLVVLRRSRPLRR